MTKSTNNKTPNAHTKDQTLNTNFISPFAVTFFPIFHSLKEKKLYVSFALRIEIRHQFRLSVIDELLPFERGKYTLLKESKNAAF